MMIEKHKKSKVVDFDKYDYSDLQKIYKGFIDDAEKLYSSPNDINQHDNAIHVFITLVTVYHNRFTDEKDVSSKETLRGYVENLQIHLTRLQQQYNQLNVQKNIRYAQLSITMGLLSTILATLTLIMPNKVNKIFSWEATVNQIECCVCPKNTNYMTEGIDAILQNRFLPQNEDAIKPPFLNK